MFANKKDMTMLFIAIGLGVAGALLSMLYLKAREAELRAELTPKQEMVEVVVASRDLVKGDVLSTATLSVRTLPADHVSRSAVKPGEFEQIDGLVLTQNLGAGRPLLHSFVDREFPLDFSDTIPLKRRAMTIQVDEVNSVSGFIRPGNRIDLFVTLPAGAIEDSSNDSQEVIPVLENVEVLATGRDAARDYEEKVRMLRGGLAARPDSNYTALTLNVTPREAAVLATAQEKGDLLAVLRNRKDQSGSGFTSVKPSDLKSHAQQLAAQASVRDAASALENLVVGEDGVVRTRDGKVVEGVIVAEDGTIMTKDGVVLSGRGLTVDENGNIVTADGKRIDPDKLVAAPDGSLISEDGTVLAGGVSTTLGKVRVTGDGTVVSENGTVLTGVTLNEDGKLVLADGTVVDPDNVIVRADGTVMTKDGKVLGSVGVGQLAGKLTTTEDGRVVTENGVVLSGVKLDKDGKLVLADGTVVDPDDVVIGADGSVTLKHGEVLAGARVREDGKVVLADGTVLDADQVVIDADGTIRRKAGKLLAGARVREDGKVVMADGTVLDADQVVIDADGTIRLKAGQPLPGVVAENVRLPGMTRTVAAAAGGYDVDYIVGGVSEDSVATVNKVPVLD